MSNGYSDTPVRVLIADDSWHYAQALEAALGREDDLVISDIAYSSEELLEKARSCEPHVVILDIDLPEMGGVAAGEQLCRAQPDVAVVVVTALADDALARRCLAFGARAYVVKHDREDPRRIANAIRSAARGDLVLDHEIHELLIELAKQRRDPALEVGLTTREREMVPLIAEGLQNKEIARQLGIAEQTVRNHLSNVYRKLDAKNRTQLVAEARRRGILE